MGDVRDVTEPAAPTPLPTDDSEAVAQTIASAYPKAGIDLARRIVEVAQRTGPHPYDLANLIAFESGYTFSPSIQNPDSGATGLFQFLSGTARKLGTTIEALAAMTAVDQMQWVEKYLMRARNGEGDDKTPGPLDTFQSLAMSVHYPWARFVSPTLPYGRVPGAPSWIRLPEHAALAAYTAQKYMSAALRGAKLPTGAQAAPSVSGVTKKGSKILAAHMRFLT